MLLNRECIKASNERDDKAPTPEGKKRKCETYLFVIIWIIVNDEVKRYRNNGMNDGKK